MDKIHSKCSFINGSLVNGVKETLLYTFALDQSPGHKKYKEPIIKLKKISKSVLSNITFYLEDNDHKLVIFNNETISFTCHLNKIH